MFLAVYSESWPPRYAEVSMDLYTNHMWFTLLLAVELAIAGKYLTLRNAKIDMYRGSMRLAVDQWGKVEALEDANFKANVRDWLLLPSCLAWCIECANHHICCKAAGPQHTFILTASQQLT